MEGFPTDPSESRMVEPKVEAAGIEPATDSQPRNKEFQKRCDEAWRNHQLDYIRFEVEVLGQYRGLARTRQTRLYVIRDEQEDAVKIGVGDDPPKRLSALKSGNPRPLDLLLHVPAYAGLERLIHKFLVAERLTGEWFYCGPKTLVVCECLLSADDFQRDLSRMGDIMDADFTLGTLSCYADEVRAILEQGGLA